MESDRSTHWGAALISGICIIVGAVVGAVIAHGKAEKQLDQRDTSLAELHTQLEVRDTQIRDLSDKLKAQEKRVGDFQRELESFKRSPASVHSPSETVATTPQDTGGAEPKTPTLPRQTGIVNQFPFRFTFKKCFHHQGENRVDCELLIENVSDKQESLLFNPMYYMGGRVSFLSDPTGKQYAARVERGAVDNALNLPPDLIPHVATAATLHFENVPEELNRATLVLQADQGLFGRKLTMTFPEVLVE